MAQTERVPLQWLIEKLVVPAQDEIHRFFAKNETLTPEMGERINELIELQKHIFYLQPTDPAKMTIDLIQQSPNVFNLLMIPRYIHDRELIEGQRLFVA